MIAHRHGHSLTLCDSCYRPRRTSEPGWRSHPEGVPPTMGRSEGRTVETPAQPVDYCPTCVEVMRR